MKRLKSTTWKWEIQWEGRLLTFESCNQSFELPHTNNLFSRLADIVLTFPFELILKVFKTRLVGRGFHSYKDCFVLLPNRCEISHYLHSFFSINSVSPLFHTIVYPRFGAFYACLFYGPSWSKAKKEDFCREEHMIVY